MWICGCCLGGLFAACCSMRLTMFSCAAQHSVSGNRMPEEAGDRRRCQAVRTLLHEGRQGTLLAKQSSLCCTEDSLQHRLQVIQD